MQAANGAFGYAIIENGNQIDFTTNTSYTLTKRDYDATYTVRARYQNNAITQSGDSNPVSVTGAKKKINPNNYTVTVDSPQTAKVNDQVTFLSKFIKVTDADGKELSTDDYNITYSNCSPASTCTTSEADDSVTFSDKGNYELDITITIEGVTIDTKTIKFTVTE